MTWRPTPQGPCPCGTCNHEPLYTPAWTPVHRGADAEMESAWRRQASWPDVPALPPRDVGQWIEDTDPAPAEPPPTIESYEWTEKEFAAKIAALPRPNVFRRIFNSTRRNT